MSLVFDWGKINLIEISGPDAKDFLHRLATVDFKKDFLGSLFGAFLNGQGKFISLFTAFKTEDKITLFIEPNMFETTKNYLEQMHFAENLKISVKENFALEFRNSNLKKENFVEAYNWGMTGFYLFSEKRQEFSNHKILSTEDFDALRASYGFPKPLRDLTSDHLLIESPLENLIDRNKGCYPGQEVVEKVYTYGRLPRKICLVKFSREPKMALPHALEQGGENVGTLTSVYKNVGIATLKRIFLEKNKNLVIKDFEMTW
jgi:folate-binding protein YgfZ